MPTELLNERTVPVIVVCLALLMLIGSAALYNLFKFLYDKLIGK